MPEFFSLLMRFRLAASRSFWRAPVSLSTRFIGGYKNLLVWITLTVAISASAFDAPAVELASLGGNGNNRTLTAVPAGGETLLEVTASSSTETINRNGWSELAQTPVILFNIHTPGTIERFQGFLERTPMTNGHSVPTQLVADTTAALTFYSAMTRAQEPSYFVASYIDKSIVLPFNAVKQQIFVGRYGEDLYPQSVCPVFASHANASKAMLLSMAVSLPATFFDKVPGKVENYHRLFLMTEASHCGFLARTIHDADLQRIMTDEKRFKRILEAIGDYEAILAFRAENNNAQQADETDVLLAARILGMFLNDEADIYTTTPALARAYQELGVVEGSKLFDDIYPAFQTAREVFQAVLSDFLAVKSLENLPLQDMAYLLHDTMSGLEHSTALSSSQKQRLSSQPFALALIQDFVTAVGILRPDDSRPGSPTQRRIPWLPARTHEIARLTLPGPLVSEQHAKLSEHSLDPFSVSVAE